MLITVVYEFSYGLLFNQAYINCKGILELQIYDNMNKLITIEKVIKPGRRVTLKLLMKNLHQNAWH